MKKVLFKTFLLLSIIVFSSCSGNDEETNPDSSFKNEIKMTINGREVIFNQVVVGENDYHVYKDLGGAIKLTGTVDGATNEVITVSILKDKVGTGSLAEILYEAAGQRYVYSPWVSAWDCVNTPSNIVLVTTSNDGSTISGDFSGRLTHCQYDNGNETVEADFNFTEASFSVKY
ncbi:hypothetical protein SAMN04489761_2765 [Tenacibaculum sp. MAR_2009_124]|uniref:hypothetical protein n=1 Tax=Tenacibaculum sp. MAR_2009_124 TaxID=1250059 RepID=UPI00089AB3B9|nr:hypothetical protein [Tenacibaculum sp. MAR_2009_124]SEC35672.1 hypothetical protein SAMN04489761_2765 [Tenacibaculum sp. MAR_2009_124]